MSTWIDFKALRAALDFELVLRHYNVEVKRKGKQHHGYCPLPNHNGKRNSPSFSANLERGIFKCFGCGAQGNVLEFAALMEKVNPKNGAELHKVAKDLQQRFCRQFGAGGKAAGTDTSSASEPTKPARDNEMPVVVNAPLDFQLKGLDAKHPYLLNRGFTPQAIKLFGLGFCSRGMLKDRIAIPLHDHEGKLIGYAGRVVDDTKITEENPRYRLPGERQRGGTVYEFQKTQFLYNGFRIQGPVDDLIVVESFTAVWWLTQSYLPYVVGTMGSDCSEQQAKLIVSLVKPGGHIWIAPDGDTAGQRLAHSLLQQISPHRFVRWSKMEESKQVTDLFGGQLKACFTW